MEVTNVALEWDSEDTALWAAFLKTRTGQRLIPKIVEETPELLRGGETNEICVRAGEVRGFQSVIRAMLVLATPQRELTLQTTDNYPPLTDDTKWDDGAKLEP